MVLAAMNLLAFAFHTVCDCLEDVWARARAAKRARKRFFEHIRTLTSYLIFPDWETLMTTLIKSKPPPVIEKQIWALKKTRERNLELLPRHRCRNDQFCAIITFKLDQPIGSFSGTIIIV